MNRIPTPSRLALAVALAALHLGAVHAQTAPAAAADPSDGLKLDTVVITGTSTARTKMKQSVSVSTIDGEQVQKAVASSAADVLRTVPGLRAEATGGEGNANLGVRGLPMSDGGGRYVQLQEDGLPVLLIGDVSFATADQFVRTDYSLDSIQVIRGGSSSTLSTNSPGAIVNFLSKTGKETGGAIGMTLGLDHRQQRVDFNYGGKAGDKLYYHVGGFYRIGEGARKSDVTLENGGQFRASLTKQFDNGYVRLSVKQLSDRTPTYLPVPVALTNGGTTISALPGVDPRSAFFINSNFPQDNVIDRDGNRKSTNPANGLQVGVTSFGVEAQFDIGNGFTVTDRFRKSSITGRFIGMFPAGSAATDPGNGANTYTGAASVFSAHVFNTSLDDMGNVFNDLRLQKELKLGDANKLTLTGGLFSGIQKVAQSWYWNRYNVGLQGEGAALYDNAGKVTTQPVGDATTTWGGCCFRSIDVSLTAVAPYAAVTWDMGGLSIDGSIRYDKQRASGWQKFGAGANGGTWTPGSLGKVAYSTDATSYSLGANYEFSKSLAVFARGSHGASWKSPDRVIWDPRVATGIDPYPVNKVDQIEGGVKWRQSGVSAFVTLFAARTKEGAGFEVTTQTVKANSYDSKGVEAEVAYQLGNLRLAGGATVTDAKVTSGANDGKTPRRQAKLVYQLSPSYSFGSLEVGGAIIGTTKSYAQDDNVAVLPGYVVVNAFAAYELAPNATISVGVNNLFDKLAYTEAEGQGNLTNNPLYVARAINGRTVRATLKYTF